MADSKKDHRRIFQYLLCPIYYSCIKAEMLSTVEFFLQISSARRSSAVAVREQMSGPEISEYEKSILDCGLWPGLDCGIKGFGPIMSIFRGQFFHFLGGEEGITIQFRVMLDSINPYLG